MLKFPFGISHSCYWGFSTILINEDPMADGIMTEDEELEERIMISNDVVTNLFFNAGYIYSDLVSMYELLEGANYVGADSATTNSIDK